MKSFEEWWITYDKGKIMTGRFVRRDCYNAGAAEKENEMLEFILWYSDPIGRGFQGTPKEGFEYWQKNIKKDLTNRNA